VESASLDCRGGGEPRALNKRERHAYHGRCQPYPLGHAYTQAPSGYECPDGACRVAMNTHQALRGASDAGVELLKDQWVFDLGITGEQQDLRDDLGSLGVVVGEGQEDAAPMLGVDGDDAERPAR
jgi:hypothetical protein